MTTARTTGNRRLPRKRKKKWRETSDVNDAVLRMIRAIGKRVAGEDLDAIAQLQKVDQARADAWRTAIDGLRENYSDEQIGRALGITRQAVQKRWPRLVAGGNDGAH